MLLERVAGIEPALQAWEAGALPLHHTRNTALSSAWGVSAQCVFDLSVARKDRGRKVASCGVAGQIVR